MKWLKCHIEPKQLWQLVNEISLFETWKIIESGWESGLEVTIETSGIYRKNTPVFWDLFYFMMSNAQTALCVLCSWCHCRKVLILNYFIPISKNTSHLLLRIKLTQVGSHFFLSTFWSLCSGGTSFRSWKSGQHLNKHLSVVSDLMNFVPEYLQKLLAWEDHTPLENLFRHKTSRSSKF